MTYTHSINFSDGMRIRFKGYQSMDFFGTIRLMGGKFVVFWDDSTVSPIDAMDPDYIEEYKQEQYTNNYEPTSRHLEEKSCFNCGKKNDVGVKSCWWCECKDPTQTIYNNYMHH